MLEALPCAVVAPVSRARHAPTVRRVGHSSPLLDSVVPFLTLFLLAIGVSADAFAVALGRGLSLRSGVVRNGLILALAFGVAQAVMPLLGWLLGTAFAEVIAPFDLGHRIGTRFRRPAEIVGGIVLIGIGVSILVKHLTA